MAKKNKPKNLEQNGIGSGQLNFFFSFFFSFQVLREGRRNGEETGHFLVALNLIMKATLSAKFFCMKISFHSLYKHVKSFALSLAFIMRFTATRKWPGLLRGI